MTGMALSRGKPVLDFDSRRNQEWLRRRRLRLEQVRKQSNEIAKALREKVLKHEKERLEEYDKLSEMKLKQWKAEKLEELERKLTCALEDFGEGYKMAEKEPDPEAILEQQHKINSVKAQKRGEIARQEELKRKKIAEENKMAAIERKKLIRKKEDLRSALVLSIPVKKQLIEAQTIHEEKFHPEKVASNLVKQKTQKKQQKIPDFAKKSHAKKIKKKFVSPVKSCLCKHKAISSDVHSTLNKMWINLNDLQNSSTDISVVQPKTIKSTGGTKIFQKEKPEGVVEFYDFSSRYYCKSFKEYPHLVERIDPEPEVPRAINLAQIEYEKEKAEAKKKMKADAVSQERGVEALKREKINQDYNNLIARLEELNKKEKILKAQQRNLPSFLHMNDERLSERLKTKQQIMNSKFESICYDAISQVPRAEQPRQRVFSGCGGGDCRTDGVTSNPLSFSPCCLRTNTPVTSVSFEFSGSEDKPQKDYKRKQLLVNIDKTLKEGRELRRVMSRSRESTGTEREEEKEKASADSAEGGGYVSPRKNEMKKTKCQESQTEDLPAVVNVNSEVFGKTGDDSLPVSTTTSYKSPPSVIRSYRLRKFLEYMEGVSETNSNLSEGSSKFSKRELPNNFTHKCDGNENSRDVEKQCSSYTLKYYIEKLLNMSRERIADMSVSSDYLSTPNVTDVDLREPKSSPYRNFSTVSAERELSPDEFEKRQRNWKRVFERNPEEQPEAEDVPDGPYYEIVGNKEINKTEHEEHPSPNYSPKTKRRYEEITQKCSERISELFIKLDKVRKDKEKLLYSTSGGSSLSSNRDGENSEKGLDLNEEKEEEEEKEVVPVRKENPKMFGVEDFSINRYSLSTCGKEAASTMAVVDSHSPKDLEESLESWPDIMDELLRRKILSSPFKWSDVENSSEMSGNQTKHSSIETVIGNFRKEISRIKPFAFSDSFPRSVSTEKSSYFEEEDRETLSNPKGKTCWPATETDKPFGEGSSVESINHALTTLGLNWAKTILRKKEESKGMGSSSDSDGGSENEADYP